MSDSVDGKYVNHVTYLAKNDPFSRYICLGSSEYLKQLFLSMLKKRLEQKGKTEAEFYSFQAKDLSWDDWLDKTQSASFFSSQKLIVLKNFSVLDKKKLKLILTLPLQETQERQTVIVLEDITDIKNAGSQVIKSSEHGWQIISDTSLTKRQWMGRLQKRFEWYNLTPPSEFIEKLMKHTMMDLDQAIEQADRWGLTYSGQPVVDWNTISMKHLSHDISIIFNLSDALLSKNYANSLHIYFDLIDQGKSTEEILYFLLNHCILLGQVKTILDLSKSIPKTEQAFCEINPYRLKKIIQQATNVSNDRLLDAIDSLLKVDKQYKTQSDISIETLLVSAIGSI
jgi:DNA polymerase III delta subunit